MIHVCKVWFQMQVGQHNQSQKEPHRPGLISQAMVAQIYTQQKGQ